MQNNINPSRIAICMITRYPEWYSGEPRSNRNIDKIRGDLALQTISASVQRGYQTVVTYSSNDDEFNQKLHKIDGVVKIKRTAAKRAPAKRLAMVAASKIPGVEAIITTEAEKLSFVTDCILPVAQPLVQKTADIVIPMRKPALFRKTYPDYMYASEVDANSLYNEELRAYGLIPPDHLGFDLFFGPRAVRNEPHLVGLFLKQFHFTGAVLSDIQLEYDPEDYSNTQFFPIIEAFIKGYKVVGVEVPFTYPFSQKRNEEKGARDLFVKKREAQKIAVLTELMHYLRLRPRKKNHTN